MTHSFLEKKEIDLLKMLNSRTKPNISKISGALNVSRKTIQNYFNKLKHNNIIKNFTINIHPNNLKYILLEIKTNPQEPHIVDELLKISQLKSLDGIFGEFSLMAIFCFKSIAEYYKILNIIDNIMANTYFKKYQIIETIKVFKTNGIKLREVIFNSNFLLDELDYLVLEILTENQELKPISTYEIREILKKKYNQDISQANIYNKIKKLENSGIILNYAINFCPKRIGFKGKFIVRIKPKDPSKYDEYASKLEAKEEITDLFRIGEQYGLLAIIRVKEIEDYGRIIKNLYETGDIEDTWTNFVLDERKVYTNFVIN
jgi:DNA-binding Lrp family transcriptional regulator